MAKKILVSYFFFTMIIANQIKAQFNYNWGIILSDEYTQRVTSMGIDNSDNVYITGLYLKQLDLEPGPGITELNSDFLNGYLAKYSKFGQLLWAINLDMGTDDTSPNQLPDADIDGEGNAYVIGQQEYLLDSANIYFAKYNTNGAKVWEYEIPGGGINGGRTIQALQDGSCIVAGFFSGVKDFAPGSEVFELECEGTFDLFLAKYQPNGSLDWAKNFGGFNNNNETNASVNDITIDQEGAIYIVGNRKNTFDFDPTNSTTNSTLSGGYTGYVAKYDAFGNFQWVNQWDDTDEFAVPHEITTDHSNNFIVTGIYGDTIDFDFSQNTDLAFGEGIHNIFVAKYSSEGELDWGIPLKSSGSNSGISLTVDSLNNIHLTGYFGGAEGIDLDPSLNDSIFQNAGAYDMFYAKYDESGNFTNGFTIGGEESVETGIGIEIDSDNNIIIGGWYSSDMVDFDITDGIDVHSSIAADIFVVKYSLNDFPTGIDIIKNEKIKLYPNPVHKKQPLNLTIPENESYRIVLTDIKGNTLGIYNDKNNIPCPEDSGVYHLTITDSQLQQTTITFLVVD